jgi:activator of HSP90 ATPase
MSTPIHQEISFSATPQQVYRALMDSSEHAAFTGAPAEVSPDEGGACSWYGGHVSGRNIELVPNERIVQVWRANNWEAGVYSVVKYELSTKGDQTVVTLDHTGHPDGTGEHLASGWHERYWKPLEAYFSKS